VRVGVVALVLLVALLAVWEAYWRSQQFTPSYRNSNGLWARTRDRVDREGGRGTVIIGSSRVLFDIDLVTWEEQTGELPIQLALEGSDPRPVWNHLVAETEFSGLLVVGVTPPLFFTPGFGYRGDVLDYYRDETPAQKSGYWLSSLIEPWVAFYNFDAELFRVLHRQTWWPQRPGMTPGIRDVRKLANMTATRNSPVWERLDNDPEYAALARSIWMDFLTAPIELPPPDVARQMLEGVFEEVRKNVETIRSRGGEVVFIRCPSRDKFRQAEAGGFPREQFWDELLRRTDAVGFHFEDFPELDDLSVPEWSHISAKDHRRYTEVVLRELRRSLAGRGSARPELTP
jgi:hypothetical protein